MFSLVPCAFHAGKYIPSGLPRLGQSSTNLVITAIKEILKRWAKPFKHHSIILTFCSKPANRWDAKSTCKALVRLVFVLKLRLLRIDRLELDS